MEATNIPQHIKVMLERVAKENGIQNPRYEVTRGSEQGDNFVGQINRIIVLDSGDNSKAKLKLIAKTAPFGDKRREIFRTKHLFKNEVNMYDVVLPSLNRILKSKGIVPQNQAAFPGTARVYATRLSEDGAEDLVLMEDMAALGYVMADRFVGADAQHCRVIIRELARLHAASVTLKETDPEEHSRLVGYLEETMCVEDWCDMFKNGTETARPIEARFPEGTEGRAKFEAFADNMFETMRSIVQPNEQFNVICQGDTWINNVLFRYGKGDGVPTEGCLLDLQLARYATPVCDLAHFIFCSTTKTVRDQHLQQLLRDYYDYLTTFLKSFGCPADRTVTWETMEDQFRKYMKFGLGMAIIAIPVIMCEKGDVAGIDEDLSEATSIQDTLIVKTVENPARDERLSDVLQDMIDLGYT